MEINDDTPSGMGVLHPLAHAKSHTTYKAVCSMNKKHMDWQAKSNAELPMNNITCLAGGAEMLRVGPDGFWVRGVRVEQDDTEAEIVYNAFKAWMAWAQLNRDYK